MKILTAEQIRALDAYTIKHEPIASIDLMERASLTFVDWLTSNFPDDEQKVVVFCGIGNNGGDGLAVARLLLRRFREVRVILCKISEKTSSDYKKNLERLSKGAYVTILEYHPGDAFPVIEPDSLIIDAIFGSGLNRPVTGVWANLLDFINKTGGTKLAIDIPSGIFADQHTGGAALKADFTISFELPKLAFLFPENQDYVGNWLIRSIGLHKDFLDAVDSRNYYLDPKMIRSLFRRRTKYAHKGTFGHALVIAGSFGKIGAAVLASRACLRAGAGLVSVHLPRCGYQIIQSTLPEAMASVDKATDYLTGLPDLDPYNSIGIGCGIGQHHTTAKALEQLLQNSSIPLVLDADALNLIGKDKSLLELIPKDSILTPHPKEFERLFGSSDNDFDRNALLRSKAKEWKVFIILKGAHTCIATPEGECYFNSTGNPGMATAGSGDVLTGIVTALLAQGYTPLKAAILGVYLHGLAGDLAADHLSQEALMAGDLVEYLGKAFKEINKKEISDS
ncbi:MAG: NAD(P)H-hydrate dehydratase [Saprospiraceae bacterium]|nr:NAD(P)H-hydrate dehydratase [Saprospiraceae bacterium]